MNKGKRKADAMHSGVNGNEEVNRQRQEGEKALVILVTKAERLGKVLGPGWSVMTRLAELVSATSPDGAHCCLLYFDVARAFC